MRRVLAGIVAVGVAFVVAPPVALAAPPDPSAASVSSSSVQQGETFTVSEQLFNPEDFTVHDANADLRVQGDTSIVDLFDLVSCTGSISVCSSRVTSYRGPVGDLDPAGERTVVFTFRVRDNAVPGAYQLEHQFTGSDFAFAAGAGPAITVTGDPQAADLAVALDASPRGILTSRITYNVAVTNNGPAAATGVRISGTYAAGLSWAGGTGCVRVGSRGVQCDFASVPVGGTVHASFAANAGLLTLGTLTTTVHRAASSPSDPNSGNDSARRSCAALTGLLVRC
jgi:hypothetical protein